MGIGKSHEEYVYKVKRYILPSLVLLALMIGKLYFTGILESFIKWLTNTPIYMEQGSVGFIGTILMIVSDMFIGFIYVWVRNLRRKEEGYEDTGEDKRDSVTVKGALVMALRGDGFSRGYNYLWMSALSSIVLAVVWSLGITILVSIFNGLVVENPGRVLSLYVGLSMGRLALNGLIKTGVLAYTVHASVREGNILRAWSYTIKNLIPMVIVEVMFYLKLLLGLVCLGFGIFVAFPIALEKRDDRWSRLVYQYERDSMYSVL